MIDHTMQVGSTKLFVIVGVKLDEVPFGTRPLKLADLHLVAMVPMDGSDQHRVAKELAAAVARTGVPRQIVADGGADLRKGIERFRLAHPGTASVPDAAHFAANALKFYREKEPRWAEFTKKMSETAAKLRQTCSAHLMAPRLRNKARYMSVGAFVRFGRIVARKLAGADPDAGLVGHYGWVTGYAEELAAWSHQGELVGAMLTQVRREGHFEGGRAELERRWEGLGPSEGRTSAGLRERLAAYVGRWGRGLGEGEKLVGSTEILESAFGTQKRLARDQAGGGLTALSVGLGAMLGDDGREEMAADADRVTERAVQSWADRTFGKTVQWLRRRFFRADPAKIIAEPNMG